MPIFGHVTRGLNMKVKHERLNFFDRRDVLK